MTQNHTKKRPAYLAYSVELKAEGQTDKPRWTPIGAVWPHKDNEGYDITLDALPIGNRITLRVPKDKDDRDGAQ
jgi:hypothetical protein